MNPFALMMDSKKREADKSENDKPSFKKMRFSFTEDLLHSLSPFESVTSKILSYLSLQDMSRLCITSKYMTTHLFELMATDSFAERIALSMLNIPENGASLEIQCHRVGLLAKRCSWLSVMKIRMEFFFLLTTKIQLKVLFHRPDFSPDELLNSIGIMLHIFVAGWEDTECEKICAFLCEKFNIMTRLKIFFSDVVGSDCDNERYLRKHIHGMFLNNCDGDPTRAMWLHHLIHMFDAAEISRIILLLYGPMDSQGEIHWNFAGESRSFEMYTNTFVSLGNALGLLKLMPNWSQNRSLEILIYISNIPTCWLLRSFASIVIPLISIDIDLVLAYLAILYRTERTNIASLLTALVMTVAPYFLSRTSMDETFKTTEEDVIRLIFSVLRNRSTNGQTSSVFSLWSTVSELAFDFAEAVRGLDEFDGTDIIYDFTQDFYDLIGSWKNFIADSIKLNLTITDVANQ